MAGDMPPPPPEDGENGAGMQGIGYQPPAPPDDSEDPFGLPPPPESLLSNLVFEEPDSPANIIRDPQNPQNLKAGSFAKILEHLTHPTVHGTSHYSIYFPSIPAHLFTSGTALLRLHPTSPSRFLRLSPNTPSSSPPLLPLRHPTSIRPTCRVLSVVPFDEAMPTSPHSNKARKAM